MRKMQILRILFFRRFRCFFSVAFLNFLFLEASRIGGELGSAAVKLVEEATGRSDGADAGGAAAEPLESYFCAVGSPSLTIKKIIKTEGYINTLNAHLWSDFKDFGDFKFSNYPPFFEFFFKCLFKVTIFHAEAEPEARRSEVSVIEGPSQRPSLNRNATIFINDVQNVKSL